ncbi:MAG TPA: hypothetical protein VIF62_17870 [Labilithrix sp.]|jgi:hypothetical protein
MAFCTNCGAAIRELVGGRCAYCKTAADVPAAAGLFVDGRGPIWRVVLLTAGPKPKKTAKALVEACKWKSDQAEAFVAGVGSGRVVLENVNASEATPIFTRILRENAEVTLERRQGADWIVTNSSQIVRDFAAKRGR